jgi:hypothetical protein
MTTGKNLGKNPREKMKETNPSDLKALKDFSYIRAVLKKKKKKKKKKSSS